ncbi:hypothetical protein HYH03_011819 [Edaphochlamys debaryana]|uniref:Pherophorin domain-containing protein n=1 Tax=Edaphochlamys debaryana TaxID=47281 RepID=A0A835XU41_9CHLO|nr:hypothetical protein HYH03_011819 [Edaphochlamys debaryana]|eukprot:KAG2489712.1 hypothetical protein HYH03_011819 [Edaphochlamys debaryana]
MDTSFCFSLLVEPDLCAGAPCYSADLGYLELALGDACASEPSLAASVVLPDGTSRPVSHSIQRGGPGSAGRVLVLRGLGLNRTTAGSARLCISSQRPACRTAEGLCQPPAGSAPGTCRAELRDSAGGCCSESAVEAGARRAVELSTAAVSPGHLPAARSLLQSFVLLQLVCVASIVIDSAAADSSDVGYAYAGHPRYAFSAATCELAGAMIARELNSAAAERGTQLAEPFAASLCASNGLEVCAAVALSPGSGPDTTGLQEIIYSRLNSWLDVVFPEGDCRDDTYGIAVGLTVFGAFYEGEVWRRSPTCSAVAPTGPSARVPYSPAPTPHAATPPAAPASLPASLPPASASASVATPVSASAPSATLAATASLAAPPVAAPTALAPQTSTPTSPAPGSPLRRLRHHQRRTQALDAAG